MVQYLQLKQQHREIRDSLPFNLSLRIHRSLSWLHCAEQQRNEDARFVFLWIAFNAAYAHEIEDRQQFRERKILLNYLKLLLDVDHDNQLYGIVWSEFPKSIRMLISNQYVYQGFWDRKKGKISEQEWLESFARSKAQAHRALGRMETLKVLAIIFERLYTLRNQLIHGGATWNSTLNRAQIRDGSKILGQIVPLINHLMMNKKPLLIGEPCYPIIKFAE